MSKNNVLNKLSQRGFKIKGPALYLIILLMVLAISYIGILIYNNMPDVPFKDIKTLSTDYHKELKELDADLRNAYLDAKETNDLTKWQGFSQEWVSQIGALRPNEFDAKLSKKSRELVNAITYLNRDLFQLWTEYNTAITSKSSVNMEVETGLTNSIDRGFNFLTNKLN